MVNLCICLNNDFTCFLTVFGKGIDMSEETMPNLDEIISKLIVSYPPIRLMTYSGIRDERIWDYKKHTVEKPAAWSQENLQQSVVDKASAWRGDNALATVALDLGRGTLQGKAIGAAYTVPAISNSTNLLSAGYVASNAVAAIGGLGTVLAVWIGAAQVAYATTQSFTLWDLAPKDKGGAGLYSCSCGECGPWAYYLANKHDIKIAKMAVSLFVVPLLFTVSQKVYNLTVHRAALTRKKMMIANILKSAALPTVVARVGSIEPVITKPGCRKAQALIATLFEERGVPYQRTLSAILSVDGAKAIADRIYD